VFPTYYNPTDVERLYEPDFQRAYEAGVAARYTPASADRERVLLWLVDVQIDFCFPAPLGRLTVPHALEDTRRTVEWLYRNAHAITHIAASLDTHTPYQIFYPSWWRDADGNHPAPFTVITAKDVAEGRWQPGTEVAWSEHYVKQLEKSSKKQLMIWPYHCMEGTTGRALVPALSEAIMFHSAARVTQPTYLVKGTIPQTEHYSVLEPEVKFPSHPQGMLNEAFLHSVLGFTQIYVCGQARSHCVLETMNSVVRYFMEQPDILRKIHFLDDCSSPITGFEEHTEQQIAAFKSRGVQLVTAADDI
jgi:nicotinamidase-related amidase